MKRRVGVLLRQIVGGGVHCVRPTAWLPNEHILEVLELTVERLILVHHVLVVRLAHLLKISQLVILVSQSTDLALILVQHDRASVVR